MSTETLHGFADDAVRAELRLRAQEDAAMRRRTARDTLLHWLQVRGVPHAEHPALLGFYDQIYDGLSRAPSAGGAAEDDLTGWFPAADVVAVLSQRLPDHGLDGVMNLVGWVTWSRIAQPDLRTAMPVAATTLRVCNPELYPVVLPPGRSDEQVRAWTQAQIRAVSSRALGSRIRLRRLPPAPGAPAAQVGRWISFDQRGADRQPDQPG